MQVEEYALAPVQYGWLLRGTGVFITKSGEWSVTNKLLCSFLRRKCIDLGKANSLYGVNTQKCL